MYESVVVPENKEYGNDIVTSTSKKKIIFNNASMAHLNITAVDPVTGTCIEVMVRKDALPEFVTNPKKEWQLSTLISKKAFKSSTKTALIASSILLAASIYYFNPKFSLPIDRASELMKLNNEPK